MNRKQTRLPKLQDFPQIPVLSTPGVVVPSVLLICLFPTSITAQTIIPAQDGTGTQVTPQGNQFNINGGSLSGNGANLFHSFEKLGLSQGQILNFISNPNIQNILGRVTGGEASFINGLIQVTGGNSNLFLINPAGIVFGESASLNIPASFTATTANSLGFGNQNWFQAIGENQWQTLVGTPRDFVFNAENPGSLVNLGNLTVSPGQNITLLAGTVLNTGTISAPAGNITIASVTGENLVRLSQEGHLLNLELTSDIPQNNSTFTALSLPELLTGGNSISASQVKVNEQGQVVLTASGITVPTTPGTTILSGTIDVSSPTQLGGNLALTGEKIGLINSTLNASGLTGGGTVLIGGNYKGLGDFPNAQKTFISSDSFINANALETGNGGQVIVWSEDLTQVYGLIEVRGGIQSGNGGFVETSSRGILDINTAPDISAPAGLGGTWLLDPNNIDIVDDTQGNTNINENPLPTGELLFNTSDDNARLSVFVLKSALSEGNVVVETGDVGTNSQDGNITFQTSLDFNEIRGERSLTLNAAGNIILDGQTISDSIPNDSDKLNLNFKADFDNNNSGSVFIRNANIDTNRGSFTATGRGNQLFRSGIWIDNSQINTLGGNITLDGIGVDNQPFNHGILLTNSSLNSANGNINLTGTSGTETDTNVGVWLDQSTINSGTGTIDIIGNSQGLETNNIGILINNNSTLQSTTGNINLTGNSENGLNSFGVNLNQGNILTVDGAIQIAGTPAGTDGSVGVYISESNITSTGTGIIDINGNNNATGNNNDGLSILNGALISTTGTGNITLSGVSGEGNISEGIYIANGQVQTTNGNILINGLGRGLTSSPGIFIGDGGEIVSTGTGNISLDGLSSATGNSGHGIALFGGANISATATGNITLVGSSSQTPDSHGILILDNPRIEVFNGNINLTGVSSSSLGGQGILLGNSIIESSGTGGINLTGTGNGSGGDNNGILLINNTEINSLASGDINIQGRSGTVAQSRAVGIFGESQIQSNTGSILIDGVNNGENTNSVIIGENTPITTTGSGSITISGNRDLLINSLTNAGGEINLQSSEGNINSSFGTLDSSSIEGSGGNIAIDAAGNIRVAGINARGNTQGGSVSLTSANNIVTVTDNINTSATTGQGNTITVSAPLQIAQPTITFNTTGITGSGDIIFNNTINGITPGSNTLILQAGNINFNDSVGNLIRLNGLTLTGNNINSIAPMNLANSGLTINASGEVTLANILTTDNGIINILATGNITTQDMNTAGGNITLESSNNIDTTAGILNSLSTATTGGEVNLTATNTINTGTIITGGETINLTSSNGEINTQAGILDSSSSDNDGGNQTLNASGTITLGGINTSTTSNSSNSQAGTLDISSGNNTINLTGDINTSATQGQGNDVNLNANVILPESQVTITTRGNNSGGNVTFNGTINGGIESNAGSNSLTIETGTGDATFNQTIGDNVPLQTLTINSGNVVSQSAVTVENGGININATQDINFSDTITANNSPIDFNANGDITTSDIISNGSRISLVSNTGNINTESSILNSSSTTEDGGEINLNAAQNLTLGAVNTRTESNLGTSQAGTLTLAGNTINLTDNIDTSATIGSGNNITFNSPVILDTNTVTLTTSGTAGSGDITFNNTVDSNSSGSANLTLQTGTGTVNINQAIGDTNPLNTLNITSGEVNSNGGINVTGEGVNINSSGTVNLTQPITATNTATININAENNITTANLSTQGQPIILNSNTGNIDSSGGIINSSSSNSNGGDITMTTPATITLGEINTSTQTNQAGTLTVTGEKITLNGTINTSGNTGTGSNLTFNNPVELNQPVTLNTSGTLGSGNITFNNTINSIPVNNNGLTIQAGNGNIQFNNSVNLGGLEINAQTVNSNSPITLDTGNLRINSSDTVTLPQDVITTNGSNVEINATNNIVTGNITTNGQPITLNSSTGNVTINPGILNTSSSENGGNITISTPQTLNLGEVNTSAIAGTAGTLNLNTGNNPIILNSDINTSSNNGTGSQQQYNSPVQLASPDITLTSSGTNNSGNIIFNNSINGNSNLTLNAGSGNITFSTVGDSNPLSSLQVNTTGLTTLQGNLTTNNNLDFSNALGGTQLENSITINTAGNNGNILFNNSPITGSTTLTLNAGSGTISLNTVGNNNNPIGGLIFQQANALNLFGDIYTSTGLNFLSVNTVNISGNLVTLDTSIGNGAIDFIGSILGGQGQLTINAGNSNVNLDTFTTESPLNGLGITAGTVQANAPITLGSGGLNINASNIVNFNANTLSIGTVAVTATNDITIRDITTSAGITLNSSNGNITVNSLNSSSPNANGGEISLSSPRGNITTNTLNSSSPSGRGGTISLEAITGNVTTGNILTSGLTGGNLTVNAQTSITTGQIDTQGQTQGGDVFLDPINDVQVEFINAESANGRGGNVFVESTQGYFRATNSFPTGFSPTGTASISTAGRLGGGSITLRHAGGPLNPPVTAFEIGGNLTVNGTAAAITTGDFSILPPQGFEGSFTSGNIAIETDDGPNIIPPIPGGNQPLIETEVILQKNLLIPPNNQEQEPKQTSPEVIINYNNSFLSQELLSTVDMAFSSDNLDSTFLALEQLKTQEFQQHLGVQGTPLSRSEVQQLLKELEMKTRQVYAIVYVVSREDQLELIVVPSSGQPLRHSIAEATQEKLFPVVRELQSEITNPRKRDSVSYQAPAAQLHQWIIQPIEDDLKRLGVSTILFSLDPGLRSLPLAVLWDGQQFLVEKYGISLIPSTSLIDFRYQPIGQAEVLAMGASQFQQQNPLPAVPIELENIIEIWPGEKFLNERFTLDNLKSQRRRFDFKVIHLATHADFKTGSPSNSYIQLWNEKLPLTELPNLGWDNPTVELLTLSACRTALGDRRSELGFAGLAVQAGVKSALASLWYVSDQGTLGLMSEFYEYLKQAPIKAIGLQEAQIAMIQGKTRIENQQLITTFGAIPLPPDLTESNITTLSHPYYWSGFTMIGSPW
ncbi:CHAT domain-containing protein [Planktothrix paucivesiculata]|uniref:Filamentous hemagglutinin family outer membrane protein n=1 Tax=Planktothrix paucivesiculata PCC 9631 TaxID=671071 RepID=A0A7Z9BTZ6_9CYAN|nr:CHAT domain-containing protein [Planktothrix paucivesiculata]VXD22684.1 putative Filamentous hemagglutinin family outer membrane protein [Planktothrix paucivesiculata PCC 9631]